MTGSDLHIGEGAAGAGPVIQSANTGGRDAFGVRAGAAAAPDYAGRAATGAASPADAARRQAEGAPRRKVVRRARATVDSVTGAPIAQQAAPAAPARTPADAARAAAGAAPTLADAARSGARARRAGPRDDAGAPEAAPAPRLLEDERAQSRRKKAVLGVLLVLLVGVSACYTGTAPAFVSPVEVVQIWALRIQQLAMQLVNPAAALTGDEAMALHPTYYHSLTSFAQTLVYAICGCMLALSGALYQNAFRNPIASPSMLGVSNGIQLAVAVLVAVFGTMAGAMLAERYVVSYVAVALVLAVLFGCARLMSGLGRPLNVTNLLLVGVIINQFVGVVVNYFTFYVFDEELYEVYMGLTSLVMPATDPLSWGFLLAGVAVAVVPVALLRFRLNALSFSPAEMRMFGVRPGRLQAVALLCGTIVMVTAQLQVGLVAMVTLVVPHLSRAVFGAEFRKQLSGTLLIGACVLVACHVVAVAIPYQGTIPVGVVVNLVLLPAFVWLISSQQAKWE